MDSFDGVIDHFQEEEDNFSGTDDEEDWNDEAPQKEHKKVSTIDGRQPTYL